MHEKQALFPVVRSCTIVTLVHARGAANLLRDRAHSTPVLIPCRARGQEVEGQRGSGQARVLVVWSTGVRGVMMESC